MISTIRKLVAAGVLSRYGFCILLKPICEDNQYDTSSEKKQASDFAGTGVLENADEKGGDQSTDAKDFGARQVVVQARKGFPSNRILGFCTMPEDLKLTEIKPVGWARENTNLCDFLRWYIIKVNSHSVRNQEEFNQAKASLSPGDPVTFVLEKREDVEQDTPDDADQISITDNQSDITSDLNEHIYFDGANVVENNLDQLKIQSEASSAAPVLCRSQSESTFDTRSNASVTQNDSAVGDAGIDPNTGIEEVKIRLVMAQAGCSREQAINSLSSQDNDVGQAVALLKNNPVEENLADLFQDPRMGPRVTKDGSSTNNYGTFSRFQVSTDGFGTESGDGISSSFGSTQILHTYQNVVVQHDSITSMNGLKGVIASDSLKNNQVRVKIDKEQSMDDEARIFLENDEYYNYFSPNQLELKFEERDRVKLVPYENQKEKEAKQWNGLTGTIKCPHPDQANKWYVLLDRGEQLKQLPKYFVKQSTNKYGHLILSVKDYKIEKKEPAKEETKVEEPKQEKKIEQSAKQEDQPMESSSDVKQDKEEPKAEAAKEEQKESTSDNVVQSIFNMNV